MSSAQEQFFSEPTQQSLDLNEYDIMIGATVKQYLDEGNRKISWKKIAQKIQKRYKIKLTYKYCQRRWKNYIDNNVDPKLQVSLQVQEKIFQLHACGCNLQQIKIELKLPSMNETKFKNIIKVKKHSMGRVLKGIYDAQVREANIPQNIFKSKKDHFKIFLILFSTSQLLSYYSSQSSNPISVIAFRKLTIEYDKTKKYYLKLKPNSPLYFEYQRIIEKKQDQIISTLQKILALYQTVYFDQQKLKELIGTKDKKLDGKYFYLNMILLKTPLKVMEGHHFATQQQNPCQEQRIDSQISDGPFGLVEGSLMLLPEIKQEIYSRKHMPSSDSEEEDDIFDLGLSNQWNHLKRGRDADVVTRRPKHLLSPGSSEAVLWLARGRRG